MDRRPLREYLDNPLLLQELSLEYMESWAQAVPYPGIIRQLMAMKVVQEPPSETNKEIIKSALAHSPDPHKLSRDLYQLALAYENRTKGDSSEKNIETPAEMAMDHPTAKAVPPEVRQPDALTEEEITAPSPEVSEKSDADADESKSDDDSELTSFSQWLLSIETQEDSIEEFEPEDQKEIVSEALASLLVRQGHTEKAITMYQQLALKYPEKSTYFAAQIENLQVS